MQPLYRLAIIHLFLKRRDGANKDFAYYNLTISDIFNLQYPINNRQSTTLRSPFVISKKEHSFSFTRYFCAAVTLYSPVLLNVAITSIQNQSSTSNYCYEHGGLF